MKHLLLILCLFSLLSCGSSSDSGGYEKRSVGHLEAVFYPLFDNFSLEADDGKFEIMPDDNLAGDNKDFSVTLQAKLVADGFIESDIKISVDTQSTEAGAVQAPCALVKTKNSNVYICNSNGIVLHRALSYNDGSDPWFNRP